MWDCCEVSESESTQSDIFEALAKLVLSTSQGTKFKLAHLLLIVPGSTNVLSKINRKPNRVRSGPVLEKTKKKSKF